jgi:acetyl esterase/lipase
VEAYGDGPLERGEWWVPDDEGPWHAVMLVHGGYWRPTYDRSLEDPLAADLSARGYLVWNADYAAADAPFPTTLDHVLAAYDHAAADPRVRTLTVVGHSAGGHLALWLAAQRDPALVVAQAPVAALAEGFRQGLGGGAIGLLLGGAPEDHPQRYAVADPVQLLPTGVRTLLIHGDDDEPVPLSQSQTYLAAARAAGDDCTLQVYAGGHFEHLDPTSRAVELLREALPPV